MTQVNLTPFEDVLDGFYGKKGTPARDKFEADVDESLHAYRIGEAIKKARLEQHLTQEELGERLGVKNHSNYEQGIQSPWYFNGCSGPGNGRQSNFMVNERYDYGILRQPAGLL